LGQKNIAIANIDCDLQSSTTEALDLIKENPRIKSVKKADSIY